MEKFNAPRNCRQKKNEMKWNNQQIFICLFNFYSLNICLFVGLIKCLPRHKTKANIETHKHSGRERESRKPLIRCIRVTLHCNGCAIWRIISEPEKNHYFLYIYQISVEFLFMRTHTHNFYQCSVFWGVRALVGQLLTHWHWEWEAR